MEGEKIDKMILNLPNSEKKKIIRKLKNLISKKRFHPDGQKVLKEYVQWIKRLIPIKKKKKKIKKKKRREG